MSIIQRHGKTMTEFTMLCPKCECIFTYGHNEINSDGYVKCPECDTYINHKCMCPVNDSYERDIEREKRIVDECLDGMDFSSLKKAHDKIRTLPEFDYLHHKSVSELKETAAKELMHCFEQMYEHGYRINYKNGDKSIGYQIEGVFNVETYYDLITKEYGCSCSYAIVQSW